LYHRQNGVLGVAHETPWETSHEVTAHPFAGDPQHGRQRNGPPAADSRREPRDEPGHDARVERAVGRKETDGDPPERPRNGAVEAKRVVEPAQQDKEEHRAREPTIEERLAR